ncbi:MAG: fibronectin type III domain-containing protein [Anaerolineaceae bacterium]|nr:fibronectin type III domain-containing protein [Anaerolineaceae bacterium]
MLERRLWSLSLFVVSLLLLCSAALAQGPITQDDPRVRMPGTQPEPENKVDINDAAGCLGCHGGFNPGVEPGHNWQGSMMAQAGRDFIFWPTFVVAAQDSKWALPDDSPNAADICERCHFPGGWLAGRSEPPNASAMRQDDYDGLTCDFCHRLYDPFFQDTYDGVREGSDWTGYWDETGLSALPSGPAADETYQADVTQSLGTLLFNGSPFFGADHRPFSVDYTENGAGQYFVSEDEPRRASFADAQEGHARLYSRYHKSRFFCSTCHDVSNPVLHNLNADPADPLPSETDPAYSYFHVERTWSEFALSDYAQQGGAAGLGPFAPGVLDTSQPGDVIASCQDCHMRDVVGRASVNPAGILRPNGSQEHPNSGLPLHDLTGGSAWVAWVLASAVPGSPNFDQTNHDLLWQGPAALTLDLSAGLGITHTALLDGAERAKQQIEMAAEIQNVDYKPASGTLSLRIQNQTGHKLLSGYPEGRRMFLNVRAYQEGELVYEVNPYDHVVGTLKGLPGAPLGPDEVYRDDLVYEAKMASALSGEETTFHFALATGRYKDNRIPPKGFRLSDAAERLVEPVWEGGTAPDLYTGEEYQGGYDDVSLPIVPGADAVEVRLYYQTTSREYISFLRDEINGTGGTLPAEAYVAQTDPFFAQLRAWGDTIWALWDHNKDVPGAAPYLMAEAGWQVPPAVLPLAPELLSAVPGRSSILLAWSAAHDADPLILGYRLYYDQAGKVQLVDEVGLITAYQDAALTPGEQYCYRVASLNANGESSLSNVLCAQAGYPFQLYLPVVVRD